MIVDNVIKQPNSDYISVYMWAKDIEFNPEIIMKSGQVFRLSRLNEGGYCAISGKHCIVFVKVDQTHWVFHTKYQDWLNFWWGYFDFSKIYEDFDKKIHNSNDKFLINACKTAKGMRILRQDLWETIVSFIISQQNNIPKITKTINILCERFGTKYRFNCKDYDFEYYAFPTPVQIASLSPSELSDGTLLGYRAEYLTLAAQDAQNEDFFSKLQSLDYEESLNTLMNMKGIGPKVANCIALYGLHHMESYPIDVWMKRIIEEDYSQYSQKEYMDYINFQYSGFQGYVQQLQFFYKRTLKT